MPPCHGGDRRFESARGRHTEALSLLISVFVEAGEARLDTDANRRSFEFEPGREGTVANQLTCAARLRCGLSILSLRDRESWARRLRTGNRPAGAVIRSEFPAERSFGTRTEAISGLMHMRCVRRNCG